MSAPDHYGFLEKEGGKLVSRKQTRWFELRGTNLLYYKNKPTSPSEEPQGVVDLRDTRCIDNPKERFSWAITGPRLPKNYVLCAANEEEKRTWIYKLEHTNAAATTAVKARGGDSDEDADGTKVMYSAGGHKVCTDDFEIIRVIGKGSFGKVMEVRKKDTGATYAMKEMSKEVIERENLLEHIFAEKSILQKIDHPYIVSLHFAFQTKDKLYLVLDFLSGGELFYHLSQAARFDEWRAKFYCAQIGSAVGHLHSLDIIYRDLKPENAVLDRDGNVCLTDFGLAKTGVQGAYAASTFCGTPEYLAPEFLMGGGHGKAVDWWSLGILLYEMLAGIPPFYSENVNEMYELILKKPLEFPDDMSPNARDLCTRLLDRNPDTRLQDVRVFMSHPFFADIDWGKLLARQIPAPFKPATDATQNFDPEFTGMKARLSMGSGGTHTKIEGFTYDEKAGGGVGA